MGLKNLTISMILIMLFIISMVSFGVNISEDNNSARSITDDSTIADLSQNVSTTSGKYKGEIEEGIQAYKNSTAVVGGDSPQKESEESTFTSIYRVPMQTFQTGMDFVFVKIFGGNENVRIVFIIISSFVALLFLAYVIRAIRSGEVD